MTEGEKRRGSCIVYMLRCKGDRLYTGVTNNLARRVSEHRSAYAGAKFTRAFPPETIAAAWETDSRSAALKLESRIKKLTRVKKDRLIETNDFSVLPERTENESYRRIR